MIGKTIFPWNKFFNSAFTDTMYCPIIYSLFISKNFFLKLANPWFFLCMTWCYVYIDVTLTLATRENRLRQEEKILLWQVEKFFSVSNGSCFKLKKIKIGLLSHPQLTEIKLCRYISRFYSGSRVNNLTSEIHFIRYIIRFSTLFGTKRKSG